MLVDRTDALHRQSHAALVVIAAVACLFMVCAVAIAVWLATGNSLTPRGRMVQQHS